MPSIIWFPMERSRHTGGKRFGGRGPVGCEEVRPPGGVLKTENRRTSYMAVMSASGAGGRPYETCRAKTRPDPARCGFRLVLRNRDGRCLELRFSPDEPLVWAGE